MAEERAIIHVDMDAFYASVEQRDEPALRGLPVVVGGDGDRGVVAAASYEARRFGIHSAMPSRRARRLCPELVFVRPRMAHYKAESQRVFAIFGRFTPLIEPLSLDEAFLDITGTRSLHGTPVQVARTIKRAIHDEVGLVASVGVAGNKFLAKLASDQDKPDGLTVIDPARLRETLDPLPVERMWGVGRKGAPKLRDGGFRTFRDLRLANVDRLAALVGKPGADRLMRLAAGIDDRPVTPDREEKSISNEVTLDQDLREAGDCQRVILELAVKVARRLRAAELTARTLQLKIRTAAFRTYTRSRTLDQPVSSDRIITEVARQLFERWWSEKGPDRIRLLGVGTSLLTPVGQGGLFEPAVDPIDVVGDQVRDRFGVESLRPARIVRPAGDDTETG